MIKMFRIKALNCSKANGNNELQLAKEAQETIFESEYIRAISLIKRDQRELAGKLFHQLLQTEVINEVNAENAEKMWTIRYNCHKHLALMFNDANDFTEALRHHLFAMTIDNRDVNTLYQFGQLALQLHNVELGAYVFETCLHQNIKNWRATNGLLEAYIKAANIMAIYELALILMKHNIYTKYAIDILNDIRTKFKIFVVFYEKVYEKKNPFHIHPLAFSTSTTTSGYIINTDEFRMNKLHTQTDVPIGLPSLIANDLNFYHVGKYLQIALNYLDQHHLSMLFKLAVKENSISQKNHNLAILNSEMEKNLNIHITESVSIPSDTKENFTDKSCCQTVVPVDSNVKLINENSNTIVDQEITKSKSRRRCSDLHLLEQWGWHKTRKTSRKKSLHDRYDVDYSLQGFFKRAFAKYMKSSPYKSWPFSDVDHFKTDCIIEKACSKCIETISLEDIKTNQIFNNFFEKVKIHNFDLMLLNYWWVKELSQLWNKSLPSELKSLYVELFPFFLNSFEFSIWNEIGILDITKICLLYLELEYSKATEENRELSKSWRTTFDYMSIIFGYATIEFNSYELHLRMLNAEYLMCNLKNNTVKSVQVLQHMENQLLIDMEIHVHLPNIKSFCITFYNVRNRRRELEWVIRLKEVPHLFENHQWSELSTLIKEFIQNIDNWHKSDNWLIDFKNLNEILLQCLWNSMEFEECLLFAEKFLHYSTHYYLQENKPMWVKSITYALSYIEVIISNEGSDIVEILGIYLGRLIQNIVNILTYQLESENDKKGYLDNELEMRNSWIILHKILQRDENLFLDNYNTDKGEDFIPMPFMLLFTAHEYLGNHQICSSDGGQFLKYIYHSIIPNLGAPIYDSCRNNIYEFIEQVTYCLFGFPPKKARSKHLEDHNSTLTEELTWNAGIDIFDIYAPESLPEFNSYKVESITSDMEQFFLKLLILMPQKTQLLSEINQVNKFIEGAPNNILNKSTNDNMPYKIKNIYYLLADYYFKSRDFKKAIKYYTYDLAVHKDRFDSWAGMSLSKASNIETILNGLFKKSVPEFLSECEEVIRCFDKCISLVHNRILLWIEYGSFAYTIASFCSRTIKHLKEKNNTDCISLLTGKMDKMLTIAQNCFSLAESLQSTDMSNIELSEEKWLCHYMLGKIAEKRREKPNIYLNYYLSAANYLYECNASYPIKINHNNPTTLSVEALEVFYRTNSAIIKHVQKSGEITKETLSLFKNVIQKLSNSPFAFNKAKIDDNNIYFLKRKNIDLTDASLNKKAFTEFDRLDLKSTKMSLDSCSDCNVNEIEENKDISIMKKKNMRRLSQESSATSMTMTTISTSSLSHIETDSDSSSLDIHTENSFNYNSELESVYEEVLKNLEECVIRFPEHYKSLYRLIYFYLNGPSKLRDLSQCEKLLLSQYKTRVGNIINGLFFDRKASNIFYGIWRIPSPEIDRPGSFSSHLVKCVKILIELLHKQNNFTLLMDIILQLYKTPDNDKRYILDTDRVELYEIAMSYCEGCMREILNKNKKFRNDTEIINLLIDIYKIKKKCFKYMVQKASWFSKIFVDVYLFFIENKVHNLPDDLNYADLAIKLCQQEINLRKSLDKDKDIQSLSSKISNICEEAPVKDAVLVLRNRIPLRSEEFNQSVIELNSMEKLGLNSGNNNEMLEEMHNVN